MRIRPEIAGLTPYEPGKRLAGGIKLSSNENPHGASPAALAVIGEASRELNRYPDGGAHDLRAALAERWDISPDMLVLGNGSDEIMVMIAGAFVTPGSNVVTGAHTFSQYAFAGTIFGAEIRTSPMPDGRFDLSELARLVDAETRVVFLCSPNNPTGTIIPKDELERFLGTVRSDTIVAVDEAYGEFVDSAAFPDSITLVRKHANVVRLRTFSKIYGLAALRVGYAVAQPELAGAIARLRQPFNVGTIAQRAALAALGDTGFVDSSLASNREERARLVGYLEHRGIGYLPSEANFVCADFGPVTTGHDRGAAAFVSALREHGITVRPLASFGMPDHLRISVGTREEMDAFYAAMDSIIGGKE
jgi:histidinol-phosphate aminotransferase